MLELGKDKQRQKVEIVVSNRTIIKVIALVGSAVILFMIARKVSHALLLIFIAFILAVGLNAPVSWLARRLPHRKNTRTLAISISFLIIVLIFAGFIASIAPPLINQTRNFLDVAPELVEESRNQNSGVGEFIRRYNLQDQVDDLSDQLSGRLGNLGSTFLNTLQRVGGSLFSLLTVLVLTFMMLLEGPRWLKFARRLVPPLQRQRVEIMAYDMYRVIKGYINGQLLLAALAAVFIFVPLVILNVSYPVALMVVVFVCGLIPMVGHTIGAILVSTVALFESPWTALIILVYYIAYQQIENYLLQPRVQANATNMSPLLVFSSVIIGASIGGLVGGLLAIPVAGCLRVIVLDYINQRKLLYPDESKAETQ
jgi:predicted PurR-regulated permease PerM